MPVVHEENNPAWSVYILQCADGTYYTGVTTDVERRFAEHSQGGKKSAKYCKGRQPLQLLFSYVVGSKSDALKVEIRIKRLTRSAKAALIADPERIEIILKSIAGN